MEDNTSELAIITTNFNNSVKNELATLEYTQSNMSQSLVKQKDQLEITNSDVETISALARATLTSNPELSDEQIAAQLLVKIKDNYPNTFMGKLAKTMVRNKWGARHGG
ncbi:hypothetical protein WKH57_01655 [Niallia taxi]|uniref:hypothetical protein n=1 Tax=Niallia taxi TaxID=2499688 RepID=UPI00317E4182